ncbi:ComEA family DNA-binding protein [Cognataquiflexum rubidum]|uniref:ComEA family DNA-binding protein n=1 Tax=Cognataquiflexum rubidum TaxID=2922273 RepID=UPI001F1364B4|nr:helix-hairpin-helix domain-containing protein [Cognataquiflexum rubidum]MCH6233407.1 helix-hairpin-helix domain-containing protein [Cognataquiflexum rubidum]
MKTLLTIGILMLIFSFCGKAQTYRKEEINIENFVEELFGMQRTDENYEDLYESLLQVFLNPINLNKTNAEELKSIFILTPAQVNSFIAYQNQFGKLISIYELQAIPDFDLETIYKLLPFVVLEDSDRMQGSLKDRILGSRDAYFIFRQNRVWETRKGYTPADTLANGALTSRYLGDPSNLYGRFRIQHSKDFSLGFTIDKDSGEQFIWNPNSKRYGFNFLSYHFTLYNQGKFRSISVGDFQMQTGQGLVFGAGFGVGKGAETITTVRRSTIGIRPYTSALEFGFFRGMAATYQAGPVNITLMASNAPRDGNLQIQLDTLETEEEIITSLQSSGLHRTATEISYKNRIREKNLGANIHYQSRKRDFQIGVNSLYTQFGQDFQRNRQVYNQYEFFGKENHLHSLYFAYNFQNYFFFGETAVSKSGGKGSVLGMMSSLHPKLGFSVLWRRFDRHFHSFYGNAFSEGTRPINEHGVYFGLNYKPNQKFSWALYYDYFKFPWLRYRVYAPSSGNEWLTRFTYSPSRKILLFAQIREESKARNVSELPNNFQSSYQLSQGKKWNYAFNLDYAIDNHWSIKSRIMSSTFDFNGKKTRGFAISQDINVDYQKWRLSTRIVLFDTEDYDNRQFIFERNVLWLFSIPALNGQGMRYYILGQYKISPKLTFWARFGRTIFTDRDVIGSGLQEIQGNTITETVFQLQYQFNR